MIAHHFGTDEIPRQCVTPGDYVMYQEEHMLHLSMKLKNTDFISGGFALSIALRTP